MRTRVKICGITNIDDASFAVRAGADALGMVFHAPSPRNIGIEDAAMITSFLPAFVTTVGLFVNKTAEEVKEVLASVPLQLLQFHGDESPEYCEQFSVPYMKALRVGCESGGLFGENLRNTIESYSGAQAVLLDTYKKGIPGGTGEKFDWNLVPNMGVPIVLAGGLNPSNVEGAICEVNPFAVDVSGGVESAPGIKDAGRMRDFISAVVKADRKVSAF